MFFASAPAEAHRAVEAALAAGRSPEGLPAAALLEHGSLTLYYYEPRGRDRQPVHEQDELYVIVRGRGAFAVGADERSLERIPFGPGDAIFVPAGTPHRFEGFSDDFATWVMMYGPPGGEATDPPMAA